MRRASGTVGLCHGLDVTGSCRYPRTFAKQMKTRHGRFACSTAVLACAVFCGLPSCASRQPVVVEGIVSSKQGDYSYVHDERPLHYFDFEHKRKRYRLALYTKSNERHSGGRSRSVNTHVEAYGSVLQYNPKARKFDSQIGGAMGSVAFRVFPEGGKLRLFPAGGGESAGWSGIDDFLAGIDLAITPSAIHGYTSPNKDLDVYVDIEFKVFSDAADELGKRYRLASVSARLHWNIFFDGDSISGLGYTRGENRLSEKGYGEQISGVDGRQRMSF